MTDGLNEAFIEDLECIISMKGILKHSEHVANMSRQIYRHLKPWEQAELSKDEMEVYYAGRFHDIGKAFVNMFYPNVLEKAKWNETDRTIIKEHTSIGSCILYILAAEREQNVGCNGFHLLHDACLFHHERLDGSGYLKLKEEQIPPIGKLVAVADCFSAGVENRVYKDGKDPEMIYKELLTPGFNQTYVKALGKAIMIYR